MPWIYVLMLAGTGGGRGRLVPLGRVAVVRWSAARGWTMAQLLRDMIRQLPDEKPS
jgi:hypothetical protein